MPVTLPQRGGKGQDSALMVHVPSHDVLIFQYIVQVRVE